MITMHMNTLDIEYTVVDGNSWYIIAF